MSSDELHKAIRRNKWTLCYVAIMTSVLFVLLMYDVWRSHA